MPGTGIPFVMLIAAIKGHLNFFGIQTGRRAVCNISGQKNYFIICILVTLNS